MEIFVKYLVVTIYVFLIYSGIVLIGEERKPITKWVAAAGTIFKGTVIFLVIWFL